MTTDLFLHVAEAITTHMSRCKVFDGELGDAVRHLLHAAESAMPKSDFTPGSHHDHSALLGRALIAGARQPAAIIANALAALRDDLPWHYHYPQRDDLPDLATRIGFAELIGPRAPLTAPTGRVGFTLMAPDTFYPLHRHPAIEIYLVIAGTAEWTTPTSRRRVPPGAFVLHRSNQPHAMHTSAEPLLALYAWHGDIDTPATYL